MRKGWLLVAGVLAVGALSGCSSYNRKWKAAVREPIPQAGISGAWDGRWLSAKNGHTGRLRCILTKVNENPDGSLYQAHFHARFWKVFWSTYTIPLIVESEGTNFTFTGSQDLGKLAGGVYRYEGTATPDHFHSTYTSKYDHGTFEMGRPGEGSENTDVGR